MGDSIPSQASHFRSAIAPVFLCVFLSGMALLAGYILVVYGSATFWHAFPVVIVAGAPIVLLEAWMFSRFFPVVLSPEGLQGDSVWGVRRFIRWQDIAAVKRFRIFNLCWLRLYSRVGREVVWLAMFQSRPIEFRDEIRKLAPKDNPLLKQLG